MKVSFAGFDMKCLKVDEYIKRTASVEETELLYEELKVSTKTLFKCVAGKQLSLQGLKFFFTQPVGRGTCKFWSFKFHLPGNQIILQKYLAAVYFKNNIISTVYDFKLPLMLLITFFNVRTFGGFWVCFYNCTYILFLDILTKVSFFFRSSCYVRLKKSVAYNVSTQPLSYVYCT